MSLPFFNWSRTAASNASADSTVNWAEGMAPSAVNDSGRAMMASTAAFRDDIAGAIATGGSATAYTVTSYQIFDTLAHLNGQMIAFTPHATSTNAVGVDVTLNVDGLGAKPIRAQPSVTLPGGSLILGTPYACLYNNADAAFYLMGGQSNPYNIPLGGMIEYTAASGGTPNSSFVLPIGQAISRVTYSALFGLLGTGYGAGDGSTTFNIIDMRGRVSVAPDGGAGVMPSLGLNSAGGVTGASQALSAANIPSHTHSGTTAVEASQHTHGGGGTQNGVTYSGGAGIGQGFTPGNTAAENQTHVHNFTTDGGAGLSGTAFSVAMPYRGVTKILRVI